jgi:hypothetical protein
VNESEPSETYAQYSFRLAREARLRKEAIANEAIEKKRQKTERSKEVQFQSAARRKEERRQSRKSYRSIEPGLLQLAGITKEKLEEIAKAKEAKAAEIESRKQSRLCVYCGDDRDVKQSGHCQDCWNEIYHGIIKVPGVSERQVHSAMCRVIRKANGMS